MDASVPVLHACCKTELESEILYAYKNTVPKIQEPVTNCDTLLTCGNGGTFSLLDLPNSLVEYNKRLGSKPEKSFQ